MELHINADTAKDIQASQSFGVAGIGLCRTEHTLLVDNDRILSTQSVLFGLNNRDESLKILKRLQTQEFVDMYAAAAGLPIKIRLIDPPIHEFAPQTYDSYMALAKKANQPYQAIYKLVQQSKETNAMLGQRGARLLISDTELFKMQVEAISASKKESIKKGVVANPEIMLPMIMSVDELHYLISRIQEIDDTIPIGTMIEVPSMCLLHDLPKEIKFISFGTNDLTQMVLGLSRDDSKFIYKYIELGIFQSSPFETIHPSVLELMHMAIKLVPKGVNIGVCGEHAGDPVSAQQFENIGVDYLSCSPARIHALKYSMVQSLIRRKMKSPESQAVAIKQS